MSLDGALSILGGALCKTTYEFFAFLIMPICIAALHACILLVDDCYNSMWETQSLYRKSPVEKERRRIDREAKKIVRAAARVSDAFIDLSKGIGSMTRDGESTAFWQRTFHRAINRAGEMNKKIKTSATGSMVAVAGHLNRFGARLSTPNSKR
jgi:hypothetical protein